MGDMVNGTLGPKSTQLAKQTTLQSKWPVFVVAMVLFISASAFYPRLLRPHHITNSPPIIAISLCPDVPSGMHRISSDFGIQFDAPEKAFTVHAALQDMPPGTVYVVKLRDSKTNMVISGDDVTFRNLETAYPVFSEHVEERNIRGATGRSFGTDRWGYLQSGERWRHVRFSTGDAVGYEPMSPKQAILFDQVVESACFSRDDKVRK
jgi:hypothetical protein